MVCDPSDPSAAPLEERPFEDLNIDELRELTRRQKAQAEVTSMGIKKERAEANLRNCPSRQENSGRRHE